MQNFFSKNISVFSIFNDQSFINTLTNDIVSFEPLGPVLHQAFQKRTIGYFFLFFPETKLLHCMQTVMICLKCESLFSGKKTRKKYFNIWFAENFA